MHPYRRKQHLRMLRGEQGAHSTISLAMVMSVALFDVYRLSCQEKVLTRKDNRCLPHGNGVDECRMVTCIASHWPALLMASVLGQCAIRERVYSN